MNDLRQRLVDIVAAWEALPEDSYQPSEVERWLAWNMKPAIDAARSYLGKSAALTSDNCENKT